MKLRKQALDGNVETLLLVILDEGPSYGYAVVQQLNERAAGILTLGEGTVYPVLHRLEEKKLIAATWRQAENGRNRKYYRLTSKGRKALVHNRQQWSALSQAMECFLGPLGKTEPNTLPQGG